MVAVADSEFIVLVAVSRLPISKDDNRRTDFGAYMPVPFDDIGKNGFGAYMPMPFADRFYFKILE